MEIGGIPPRSVNNSMRCSQILSYWFSGTTSSASQGVAEDHLGFLQYGNGGNWETFHGEGQSSSDAGAPLFLGDIGSLLSNTYTEFGSSQFITFTIIISVL